MGPEAGGQGGDKSPQSKGGRRVVVRKPDPPIPKAVRAEAANGRDVYLPLAAPKATRVRATRRPTGRGPRAFGGEPSPVVHGVGGRRNWAGW